MSNEDLSEEFDFMVSSVYRYLVKCLSCDYSVLYSTRCKWVKIDGDEYRISSGVILDVKDDLPVVGVIQDIYVVNGNKVILQVEEYSTSFNPHYRAYVLDNDPLSSKTVCHSDLFIQTLVHIHTSCIYELSPCFVILPYALIVL